MPQDNGFEIRFEDPRIGYFTDRVTDLSSTEITPYRDLVQILTWLNYHFSII